MEYEIFEKKQIIMSHWSHYHFSMEMKILIYERLACREEIEIGMNGNKKY